MDNIKITAEIKKSISVYILNAICTLATCMPNTPEVQIFSIDMDVRCHENTCMKITHFIPSLNKEYSITFTNQLEQTPPLIAVVIVQNGNLLMLSDNEFHELIQH